MYVAYFDEVKAQPANGQHWYIVGGLAVPLDLVGPLEERMTDLSVSCFQSPELTQATEFHASHMYAGKSYFKGIAAGDRIAMMSKVMEIVCAEERVKRVYAAIDTRNLYNPAQAPEFAFAHFVERLQMVTKPGESAILIGDLDDEQSKSMVADFSRFRARGTPWAHGIEITRVVDSVHFCRSHHCRMIQLADAYVFSVGSEYGTRKGWQADAYMKAISGFNRFPNRYKVWPKT